MFKPRGMPQKEWDALVAKHRKQTDAELTAERRTMLRLLKQVYREIGPRESGLKVVPAARLAVMPRKEFDRWDYPMRFLAKRIAKVIS